MPEGKFVLFDFDGVIVDTFAVASALAKRVCVENSPARYRSHFEGSIYKKAFAEFTEGEDHQHGPDCQTTLDWWAEYEKSGAREARSFPGVIEAVRSLAQKYSLVIISSGHGELFVKPALENHSLSDCFTDVLGAEVHTSKAQKIEMVFEKYGLTPERCVFITDTLGDIREATEKNVAAIACSWGFHAPETLARGEPFLIVDSPQNLSHAVDEYFARS